MPATQEPISLSCFYCCRLAGLLECDNMSGQTIEPSSCQSQSQSIKPNWLSAKMAAISTQTFRRTWFWHLLLPERDRSSQRHEPLSKSATPTLSSQSLPVRICMCIWRRNKTIRRIMSGSLTFLIAPQYCWLSRAEALPALLHFHLLFIHSLLVWLRLGDGEKKETPLLDRNPQQLSEGFSSKNKIQHRFKYGGRKQKNIFCFWYLTWV